MIKQTKELPCYLESAELGAKGVRMVADAVEDCYHWIFRPNEKADVGIDGEMEYVYPERKSSGRLIAIQIKCGPSYFGEKTDRGYIFRCRKETINYWLALSLPVILCLCDNKTNQIYWCHITVDTIQKLDVNYKIEVPFEQQFNEANRRKLERIFQSSIPMQSIADAAIFRYLYERYQRHILICPLMEEPHDFHQLSYIAQIDDEWYMIGSVIDRYGYFEKEEVEEQIRLYYENLDSCGWSLPPHPEKSKFYLCFVSESAHNLMLEQEILDIMKKYEDEIVFDRLLLDKEYLMATLVDEEGTSICFFNEDGSL